MPKIGTSGQNEFCFPFSGKIFGKNQSQSAGPAGQQIHTLFSEQRQGLHRNFGFFHLLCPSLAVFIANFAMIGNLHLCDEDVGER